ncbi:hypothetical protein Dtox_2171 [Desulfofarcimen acetoxidans DSM 771]|uniref:Uncharacterized protein n=1 Tax=Desulfofarcimen acetoxidans (strain ATCC 49208 / DSM 771 / KCTC 5769 / VKM B-1644 / 5575) TaxID=485916 RepID=C8VZ83_DESAS|nr:methyltransferase [Desulfofarcimen acetoxidans]ACV62993.1 hypothetical protein Dtox_2171 [Desulfofarcimen acetoxidans DSM 771]
MKYLWLITLWISFGTIHSLLASTRVKGWFLNKLGKYFAFYGLAYNLISTVMALSIFLFMQTMNSNTIINYSYPWDMIQKLLLAGSVIVMAIAFLKYDSLEFLGIRQIMIFFSKNFLLVNSQQHFINTGLFRIVRHPIYLAAIIFLWCKSKTVADIISSAILTMYIIVGSVFEERKLALRYGQDYLDYKKQVPMFIPFFKKRVY